METTIEDWAKAQDEAERDPVTAGLPKSPTPGDTYTGEDGIGVVRKWVAVEIVVGLAGARWGYWKPWYKVMGGIETKALGLGPHPNHIAIADTWCNPQAGNFIGMFGVPFIGLRPGVKSVVEWVMVEPKVVAKPAEWVVEEKPRIRYERSDEERDQVTGEIRKIKRPEVKAEE